MTTTEFLKHLYAKAAERQRRDGCLGEPILSITVPKSLIQADGTLDMNKARQWCDDWLKKRFA
jgi:hypothetical protein